MNEALAAAIIGHLVGDYILQNDWMAKNKKASSVPCAVHCCLWTASVCLFAGWVSPLVIAVLWIEHFIQDRTQIVRFVMTRITGQAGFTEPPFAPWSLIVVDNTWHLVTIWAVWRFIA